MESERRNKGWNYTARSNKLKFLGIFSLIGFCFAKFIRSLFFLLGAQLDTFNGFWSRAPAQKNIQSKKSRPRWKYTLKITAEGLSERKSQQCSIVHRIQSVPPLAASITTMTYYISCRNSLWFYIKKLKSSGWFLQFLLLGFSFRLRPCLFISLFVWFFYFSMMPSCFSLTLTSNSVFQ